MSLKEELGLRKPLANYGHEALLNIYFTSTCIKKQAVRFLEQYGLTEVQLNLMMMLNHQADFDGGLSQARLSDMMLSNRANITSLVDRLEQAGFVKRTADPQDRRYNIIILTPRAKKILEQVEPAYGREVARIMDVLSEKEKKQLISMLEKVRKQI